jgi:foldase protein PrsA
MNSGMASRTSAVVALTLVLAALAGCGGKGGAVASGQIAKACGVPVTQAQFDSVIAEGKAEYKLHKQPFPATGSAKYETLKQRIVQLLVGQAAQTEEAAKLGVHVTDTQVSANIKTNLVGGRFKGSQKAFEKELAKEGFTLQQIEDQVRSGLVQKGVFDKLGAKFKVHDPEIKAYYDQNRAQYVTRPARQVRQIFVKTKAQATAVLAQLRAGADFATLAKKLSLDPSAKQTGGAQLLQQGTLTTADDKAVFALPVGKVSQPVHAGSSWAIVKAVGKVQPAHQVPLAQVRLRIVQFLLQQKQQKAFTAWQSGVQKRCTDKAAYAKGYAPPKAGTTSTATTTSGASLSMSTTSG